MRKYSRRSLLGATGAGVLAAAASTGIRATAQPELGVRAAADDAAWADITHLYDVIRDPVNVENGYWGAMARPVAEAYARWTLRVNHDNSWYARRQFGRDVQQALTATAELLGAHNDELAFTRGATEALLSLIGGFNNLARGEAVMYADLDYDSMQAGMNALAHQRGARVVRLKVPDGAAPDDLVAFYRQALDHHCDTRLLLLTHLSHRTGLVMPVRRIIEEARQREVAVIVDAAHSWGQMDFRIKELGADFVGLNLHKWIGAPLGVGLIYIRRGSLSAIAPHPGAVAEEHDSIRGRIHTGTSNFAAYLTVPEALTLHQRIGPAAKEARLRHLRSVWVSRVRAHPRVQVLTPEDPRSHVGITSFRLAGQTSVAANRTLAERLLERHGIFTIHRHGVADGACVRVTPALHNDSDQMAKVAAAILAEADDLTV